MRYIQAEKWRRIAEAIILAVTALGFTASAPAATIKTILPESADESAFITIDGEINRVTMRSFVKSQQSILTQSFF